MRFYKQIYCTKDANDYVLTNDSWTLDNLEQLGFIFDIAKLQEIGTISTFNSFILYIIR